MKNGTAQLLATLGVALALALVGCAGKAPPGGDDDDDGDGGPNPNGPDADVGGGEPDAALAACVAAEAGGFTYDKIATWRDDAKSAYSMIHDDMCDPSVVGIGQLAVPSLNVRGLKSGIGTIAGACDENAGWAELVAVEAQGHEIVNHSYSHPQINAGNAAHEINDAKTLLDSHIVHPISFFIWPYDYFTADTIAAVGGAGHLGARGGNRDDNDGAMNPPINSAEPIKDLEVEFDVWPRNYSKYARYRADDMLAVHVWNGIERGGWAMREFHSVIADGSNPVGQGFGPIELTAYKKHLDFLVDGWKSNQVWTANPSEVIRYRHARKACKASVNGDQIVFDASAAECVEYATPISVIVKTGSDIRRIDALQDGVAVSARKIAARTFSVTADPTKGDVTLSGCGNEGPEVATGIQLTPKPTPAASVCDLEKVTGAGSPGKMDDLERPAEQFQALPNPSQGDGRTGTWSWYPQNVVVAQTLEGSNTVLRYKGGALAAWTGVTLAFLGGNGAGSCYDAGQYTGIRFKIKGSVVSPDELNGKVILSLVTAETQTQTYGGDLNGEGGHFNKQIAVTSSWQTVSIPWADFAKPTWGATATLTTLAKGKLQAIDWGISDKATTFDVFFDDIELY